MPGGEASGGGPTGDGPTGDGPTGGGPTGGYLQVVPRAFEECARGFTAEGGRISVLAERLHVACSPLGDRSVGGDSGGQLASLAVTLSGNLRSIGQNGCPGIATALAAVLEKFQEVDAGEAAGVPGNGGPRNP